MLFSFLIYLSQFFNNCLSSLVFFVVTVYVNIADHTIPILSIKSWDGGLVERQTGQDGSKLILT